MARYKFLAVLMIFFFGTASKVVPADTMYVARAVVNLRGGPTTDARVLAKLPRGLSVIVLSPAQENAQWAKVKAKEIEGWVCVSLLSAMPLSPEASGVSAEDRRLHSYLQSRWDYYENRDGAYLAEHDDLVISEAAQEFSLSRDEVLRRFRRVDEYDLGIFPEPSIPLSSADTPVELEIVGVGRDKEGRLTVTVQNKTKKETTLPTVNLTCDIFHGSSSSSSRYVIVWVEELDYGDTKTYKSLPPVDGDYVKITAYANALNLRSAGLTSVLQQASDVGETVIPLLKTSKIHIE